MTIKAPQEAQKGPSEATAASPGVNTSPDDKGAQIDAEHSKDSAENNPESFSREYVETLRNEAKENRQKAARADFLATEVRRYAVKEAAAAAGLIDPESLSWSDEFEGPDGLPDHDKITAAAEALAAAKPWLSRPRGDVHQGEHGSGAEALSLSALLRG